MASHDHPKSLNCPQNTPQTLLDRVIADTFAMVCASMDGRTRMTDNLLPLVARAFFLDTKTFLSNEQLLVALKPDTEKHVEALDTKKARFLRSLGSERGLKIGEHRLNAVRLLVTGVIPKCDVVRAWTYAIINASAVEVIRDAKSSGVSINSDTFGDSLFTVRHGEKCQHLIERTLLEEFEKATKAAVEGRRDAEERRFLHYASSLVIDTMRDQRDAWAALHNLAVNVYPEIDAYEFDRP